jgi:hypothetical protein
MFEYTKQAKEDVSLNCFVVQWFLTMFTYNLPFAAIIRMWDWLFIEGHDVVFAVALAVLKLVQRKFDCLIELIEVFVPTFFFSSISNSENVEENEHRSFGIRYDFQWQARLDR